MNNEMRMRKRQMLEALEFIDDDLISGVLKKIKPELEIAEPVRTWRTPFKHWKQFVALTACLILLSVASPLANFISQAVSNFRAGAGSGTTEELSSTPITDENGVPYTYPMFVDDLEQLTAEEMLRIDELWYKMEYDYNYKDLYDFYINNVNKEYSESEASELADKRASQVANDIAKHCFFNDKCYWDSRYYGKINECVILVSVGMAAVEVEYEIAGYTISFSNYATIYVVKDEKIIELPEAYDLGYLTDDHIGLISERNDAYNLYLDSYLKEMQNKKEN